MITIIVMLILVGVTINVALNGGLFETTKSAVSETEKMAILEEIIEMAKWNNKGEVDVEGTKTSVEAKYPGAVWDEATGKLTITGKRGTYDYKISKREIKVWEEEQSEITQEELVGKTFVISGLTYDEDTGEPKGGEQYATFIFKADGNGEYNLDGTNGNFTYTYEPSTEKITVTGIDDLSEAQLYTYNEDGNIKNMAIVFNGEQIATTNGGLGWTFLTGQTFENSAGYIMGYSVDGNQGIVTTRKNGIIDSTSTRPSGYYIVINDKFFLDGYLENIECSKDENGNVTSIIVNGHEETIIYSKKS